MLGCTVGYSNPAFSYLRYALCRVLRPSNVTVACGELLALWTILEEGYTLYWVSIWCEVQEGYPLLSSQRIVSTPLIGRISSLSEWKYTYMFAPFRLSQKILMYCINIYDLLAAATLTTPSLGAANFEKLFWHQNRVKFCGTLQARLDEGERPFAKV